MNLLSLILYAIVNVAMVGYCLSIRGKVYEFPFWAGVISLGWFFPQAIGGYGIPETFPDGAYANGMFFATLCNAALWIGFEQVNRRIPTRRSWLDASFDVNRLFYAGAALCLFGFFFQYKLQTLPEEVLQQTQWSGAAVKYLFLASVFIFGFITLWLVYMSQGKLMAPRLLLFIIPSLLLLLQAAVVNGRRKAMMNFVAYVFVSMWFVRRVTLPRWLLVSGLAVGLLLINAIGTYRTIMRNDDAPLSERLAEATRADYTSSADSLLSESGAEFMNYIFYRDIHAELGQYDFGFVHWNLAVFNFVPGQIVGRGVKEGMMLPIKDDSMAVAARRYGHAFGTGTTLTGYTDAYASFSWFGFIKFWIVGCIMGALYRKAMAGAFLGQLLYVYALAPAMHAVTHGTHNILVSSWVYFFALCYPLLYLAKVNRPAGDIPELAWSGTE